MLNSYHGNSYTLWKMKMNQMWILWENQEIPMAERDIKSTNFHTRQNEISSMVELELWYQSGKKEHAVHLNQENQNAPENLKFNRCSQVLIYPLLSVWTLSVVSIKTS